MAANPVMAGDTFRCDGCGGSFAVFTSGGTGYGKTADGETLCYGKTADGETLCYGCCGWLHVAAMLDGKPVGLYLSTGKSSVSNWPGSLTLHVTGMTRPTRVVVGGRVHGWKRTVYFNGPAGSRWSGVFYDTGTAGNLLRNIRRLK